MSVFLDDAEIQILRDAYHVIAREWADVVELRRHRKFSTDQPRVPAGSPGAGQWTLGGRRRCWRARCGAAFRRSGEPCRSLS